MTSPAELVKAMLDDKSTKNDVLHHLFFSGSNSQCPILATAINAPTDLRELILDTAPYVRQKSGIVFYDEEGGTVNSLVFTADVCNFAPIFESFHRHGVSVFGSSIFYNHNLFKDVLESQGEDNLVLRLVWMLEYQYFANSEMCIDTFDFCAREILENPTEFPSLSAFLKSIFNWPGSMKLADLENIYRANSVTPSCDAGFIALKSSLDEKDWLWARSGPRTSKRARLS